MIAKETKNISEINAILCHPEIYPCISSDKCPAVEEFEPPEAIYLAGYADGEIIGLAAYHDRGGKLTMHIQVLPEHRAAHARQFGKMALDFVKNSIVYANIPTCYPNVLNFAKSFGFAEYGKKEKAHLKNGVLHDLVQLRLDNR